MLFATQSHGLAYTIGQFLGLLILLSGFRTLGGLAMKPAGKILGKGVWGIISSKWQR